MNFTEEELGLVLLGLSSIQITFRVTEAQKAEEMRGKITALMQKINEMRNAQPTPAVDSEVAG